MKVSADSVTICVLSIDSLKLCTKIGGIFRHFFWQKIMFSRRFLFLLPLHLPKSKGDLTCIFVRIRCSRLTENLFSGINMGLSMFCRGWNFGSSSKWLPTLRGCPTATARTVSFKWGTSKQIEDLEKGNLLFAGAPFERHRLACRRRATSGSH